MAGKRKANAMMPQIAKMTKKIDDAKKDAEKEAKKLLMRIGRRKVRKSPLIE